MGASVTASKPGRWVGFCQGRKKNPWLRRSLDGTIGVEAKLVKNSLTENYKTTISLDGNKLELKLLL